MKAVSSLLAATSLVAAAANAQEASTVSLSDALTKGKTSINARLRYEHADVAGFSDSDALTLRTRLAFTTAPVYGLQASLEAEDVTAVDGNSYSQAGYNAGGAGMAVIADVEGTEINQAWLKYVAKPATVTFGRQRIVLDNARFIGDVGWRQDQQTFDAIQLSGSPVKDLTTTYAYIWQVNRIFAEYADWDSQSHIFNVSYAGLPIGKLTGYAYLLDFTSAAANSTATYGISLDGAHKFSDGFKLLYRGEVAAQTDYADNPVSYNANYYLFEVGAALKPVTVKLGYEVLGSDEGVVGFKTPLATLHAFNGWADLFLATPAAGLTDTYVSASGSPFKNLTLVAAYHKFESDEGSADLGKEFDLSAAYKFNKYFTTIAKFADFQSDSSLRDTQRFSVELNFAY